MFDFDDDVMEQEFDETICPPDLPWVDDEDMIPDNEEMQKK